MLSPEEEIPESENSMLNEEGEGGSIHYQETKKDRYVGDVDPVTGLRNGKGRYKYSNPYFTYEGQWEDGQKHGYGVLKFADGGYFEGEFKDNQIVGYGTRIWADGSEYKGYWNMGEKDGEGTLEKPNGESYAGDWVLNVRHGGGKWVKPNNEVIEGEFVNNQPHGYCSIRLSNGDLYQGNVERGIINGKGMYKSLTKKMWYEGDFVNAKREGEGKYYAISSSYFYEGKFKDDKPAILPNQMLFYQEPKEEEPADSKKKDTKKGEPEEDENINKIVYEVGKSEPIKFEIRLVFQGEPYEDDTPPDEEELKKQAAAAKKGKGNEEPEVRMITPDPVIITQESGRVLEFQLGRLEDPPKPEGEGEEAQPQNTEEQEPEKIFVNYNFDQTTEDLKSNIESSEGVVSIEGLEYKLDDNFKAGKYDIIVRDVTPYIDDHMNEVRISLEVVDPEEPPVPAKGKKK